MINLLMFDLDGTLFDTAQGIANAFNRLLVERGEAPIDTQLIISNLGYGMKDLLEKIDLSLAHRLGDLQRLEDDFHKHYKKNFIDESTLYPGIIEFLNQWPHQIAVVSNKHDYYVNKLIRQTELKKFKWVTILGGNTLPAKKPDPIQIFHTLETAKLFAHNALMIGDGLPDVQAAQNAKVRSVAVSFGYSPISELIRHGAHSTITHYSQLPDVIQILS